jgi:hypothetical protein
MGFSPPKEQQRVSETVRRRRDSRCEEIAAFSVGRGQAVREEGRHESGTSEPATDSQVSRREEKQTTPTNEDKAVSLEPVVGEGEEASASR